MNISEKIKNIRIERGLSQEQLAETLGVNIILIQSWENGTTPLTPAMYLKLQEIFGDFLNISNPNLLDQQNKQAKETEENVKANKKMFTIFAILGSLFVGIGIIILLVALWDKFPDIIKTVVSFLPLIAGQAVAIFTYKKKFDNITWREGASIFWTLGVTATVGLVSMLLGLHFGAGICLFIDALLILPILFSFKTISPLVFYYGYVFSGTSLLADEYHFGSSITFVMLVYVLFGILYWLFANKEIQGKRKTFVSIVSVIAICSSLFVVCSTLGWGHFAILGSSAVLLYSLSDKERKLQIPSLIGTAIISVATTRELLTENMVYPFKNGLDVLCEPAYLTIAILSIFIIAGSFVIRKQFNGTNKYKLVYTILVSAGIFTSLFDPLFNASKVIGLILFAFTLAQALVSIIKGINEKDYFNLNVGLIEFFILLCFALAAYDWDMLMVGIMFLIIGVSFFGANFYISRKIQKEQNKLKGEVSNNE